MSESTNVTLSIDVNGFAEAMWQLGKACRQATVAFTDALAPSIQALLRAMRTESGPWYRRWYWRAAYATADAFPEWVSPD